MSQKEGGFRPRRWDNFLPEVQLDLNRLAYVVNINPNEGIPWKEETITIKRVGAWGVQAFVKEDIPRDLTPEERIHLIQKTVMRLCLRLYDAGAEKQVRQILAQAHYSPPDPSTP